MAERPAAADGTRRFFSPPGAVYLAPDPEAVHDQGDEPAEHPCPACVGGWHGEHCRGEFWTTGQPPELIECDCIEGACRGEWIEVGAYSPVDEGAIGPSLPVDAVEHTEQGVVAIVSLPPGHPAYAAAHAGLTAHLSIADEAVDFSADNGRSVNSPDTRSPIRATFQAVPVPSPAVTNGLGREHIEAHRHIPAPGRVELPEALGGIPDDAPEAQLVRYNRADRRRLQKAARKAARRGH
jgi:hypothetical protein